MSETLEMPLRYFRMFPPERWSGEVEEVQRIHRDEAALCLIDVYGEENADSSTPPPLSSTASIEASREIVDTAIIPALNAARECGITVIYVNNSAPLIHLRESVFGRAQERVTGLDISKVFAEPEADTLEYHRGENGFVGIAPELRPLEGEYFVRKHVHSGFFETRLHSLLTNLEKRWLFFCGFTLDCCLSATAMDALYRGYEVVLLRDATLACETNDEAIDHSFTQRMINWFEMMIGYTIATTTFVEATRAVSTLDSRTLARKSRA